MDAKPPKTAAKKGRGGKRPGSGRKPVARPMPRTPIITVRGSAEFAAWVDQLAEFSRRTKATMIEHALLVFAQDVGFQEKPPKR